MAGKQAIARNRYGNGWAFYVGADSDDVRFYETLARVVAGTGRLRPLLEAPQGVEVVTRESSEETYYFLLNLTETSHDGIVLPRPMEDLLSGRREITTISLGPLDVCVLALRKTSQGSRPG